MQVAVVRVFWRWFARARIGAPWLALLAALTLQACGAADEAERIEQVGSVPQTVSGPASFSIAMPNDMLPQSTAVWASQRLRLADRVLVRSKGDRMGRVVNVGQELTELGVEAKTGNIWAGQDLTLRNRASVEGNAVVAARLTKHHGAVVTGLARENTPLTPLKVSTWEPVLPSQTLGDANLEPGGSRVLPPGGYRQANIKPRATLSLSAGTYVFDTLTIEPQANLAIDDSAGPVMVYVNSQLTFRGAVLDATVSPDDKLDLLVVARGSSQSTIGAPFKGTVFAPSGSLHLNPLHGAAHFGAFFGKSVSVEPGVIINHRAFPWSQLLPPTPFEWKDAPVVLKPAVGTGGDIPATGVAETTPSAPVDFTIPPDFWVSSGNAGNGKLELTFRLPSGTNVVCQYKGGSTVANPTTDLERARGRRYVFVSCSNGLEAGAGATGTWFKLGIVSSSSNEKETIVEAHLGGGCSGTLPPALNPAEVVAIRDNFDWRTTDVLPELDPQGRPALWHGMIYIERKEQLQALDRWRVKWSATPFSRTYLDKYAGKCGRMEHANDTKGVIVYAVFPARLFNIMRNISAEALVVNDPAYPPPFRAWIPTPAEDPEYVNDDGSLKYEALASTGYVEWLAAGGAQQPFWEIFEPVTDAFNEASGWVADNIIEPALDYGEDALGYIGKAWDGFVDWVANAIDDVWESTQELLGDIFRLFGDEIEVKLEVSMQSREALMPGRMFRTWGPPVPSGANTGSSPPGAGRRPWLEPHGVQVRIRQWGWGFLPVMSEATLPAGGEPAVIKAVEGAEGRGSDQLCIELESEAGSITSDLIPNEVCGFDGPVFSDFEQSSSNVLVTNQQDLHAMTQIVDSFDYVKDIIEVEPHAVEVLTGWMANGVTAELNGGPLGPWNDKERAMALCLDFPSINTSSIGAVFQQIGLYYATPLIMKDIWWPDTGHAIDSRTMTHEYGHFLMCSLMYYEDNGSALGALFNRVGEGQNDSPDDTMALATEAFADTFAMQVMGASNYISPHLARSSDQSNMSYCQPICSSCTEVPTCLDYNYSGKGSYPHDPAARSARLQRYIEAADGDEDAGRQKLYFYEELARIESQIHDLFDRGDSSARATAEGVWNGDVLDRQGRFATTGYHTFADERVSLPGPAWRSWVSNWVAEGPDVDPAGMLEALNETASSYSHDWCQRCEAFSLHSTYAGSRGAADVDAATALADRPAHWRACAQGQVDYFDDPPPEKYGNLTPLCTPCPNLQFSDMSNGGRCTACPPGEVPRGDHCQVCPPGTEPGADNECVSCGPTQISVNGVCQPCRFAEGADRATNTCVDCNADAALDWRTVPNPVCLPSYADLLVPLEPAANDNCPDYTWVEVNNLQVLTAQDRQLFTADVVPNEMFDAPFTGPYADLVTLVQQQLCPLYQVALLGHVADPASPTHAWAMLRGASGNGTWQSCQGQPWCPTVGAESCVWNAAVTFTNSEIAAFGNRLRFRAHGAFNTDQAIPVRLLLGASRPEGPVCEPD